MIACFWCIKFTTTMLYFYLQDPSLQQFSLPRAIDQQVCRDWKHSVRVWDVQVTAAERGEGTTYIIARPFTRKQGPESGPDCLICAVFARQQNSHRARVGCPGENLVFPCRTSMSTPQRAREERPGENSSFLVWGVQVKPPAFRCGMSW